jgi:hypothetical protein
MKNLKLFGPLAAVIFVTMVPFSGFADAFGGQGSGGGDSCEDRFKIVAHDLQNWIRGGGTLGLDMSKAPVKVTADQYTSAMLEQIGNARITCVSPTADNPDPVKVNGRPKECRAESDNQGHARIICDRQKFYAGRKDPENDPLQYRIVHHEYATLAGIELPDEDSSNYGLSDQITGFLEDQIVKRLVVRNFVDSDPKNAFLGAKEREEQLQELTEAVQMEKLLNQAKQRFSEANKIDLSGAGWQDETKERSQFRAAANKAQVTYLRNSQGDACKIEALYYFKYSKNCGFFGFTCSKSTPYADDDSWASSNQSGRIAAVQGECAKSSGERYDLRWSKSDVEDPPWWYHGVKGMRDYLQDAATGGKNKKK